MGRMDRFTRFVLVSLFIALIVLYFWKFKLTYFDSYLQECNIAVVLDQLFVLKALRPRAALVT